MKLFWTQGYTATSLVDLLGAMGIARSSFYATFGDKRDVFIECLDLFSERTVSGLKSPPVDDCRTRLFAAFFETTLLQSSRRRVACGCLMVNTVLELSHVDTVLSAKASASLRRVEVAFERIFEEAMRRGSYRSELTPRQLASYAMTINQGLRVESRKELPESTLRDSLHTGLTLIGLAA